MRAAAIDLVLGVPAGAIIGWLVGRFSRANAHDYERGWRYWIHGRVPNRSSLAAIGVSFLVTTSFGLSSVIRGNDGLAVVELAGATVLASAIGFWMSQPHLWDSRS